MIELWKSHNQHQMVQVRRSCVQIAVPSTFFTSEISVKVNLRCLALEFCSRVRCIKVKFVSFVKVADVPRIRIKFWWINLILLHYKNTQEIINGFFDFKNPLRITPQWQIEQLLQEILFFLSGCHLFAPEFFLPSQVFKPRSAVLLSELGLLSKRLFKINWLVRVFYYAGGETNLGSFVFHSILTQSIALHHSATLRSLLTWKTKSFLAKFKIVTFENAEVDQKIKGDLFRKPNFLVKPNSPNSFDAREPFAIFVDMRNLFERPQQSVTLNLYFFCF